MGCIKVNGKPYLRRGNAAAKKPVGHHIREWREERGMTQAALAEIAGLATASISQLETGQQGYRQETLQAVASALGITPADLLSRSPDAEPELLSLWALIPDDRKQLALGVLNSFVKIIDPNVDTLTVAPASKRTYSLESSGKEKVKRPSRR